MREGVKKEGGRRRKRKKEREGNERLSEGRGEGRKTKEERKYME